jgi:hypothetical protein
MYLDMQCDERRKDGQYLRDIYEIGHRKGDNPSTSISLNDTYRKGEILEFDAGPEYTHISPSISVLCSSPSNR